MGEKDQAKKALARLEKDLMDPGVVTRYLTQQRKARMLPVADSSAESNPVNLHDSPFSFRLSHYPWTLQQVSSLALSSSSLSSKHQPADGKSQHNTVFVDSSLDYLELRRRQNQDFANQQYQKGLQEQQLGHLKEARQTFQTGLELVPAHENLQRALENMDSARCSKIGDSSNSRRRSHVADKSSRSKRDALLEQELLSETKNKNESFGEGGKKRPDMDPRYPLLSSSEDSLESKDQRSKDRRSKRRRKSKKRSRSKRRKKSERNRRKRKRKRYDSSSDSDSSDMESRDSRHKKGNKTSRRRDQTHRKDDDSSEGRGSSDSSPSPSDIRRRKHRKRRKTSQRKEEKFRGDEQAAGDRTREESSLKEETHSYKRRRKRKDGYEHKRSSRRDDSDDGSALSKDTVDSFKLVQVSRRHGTRDE